MKRKLSLLLAMVLAMTMVMGISVTAFAATRSKPADYTIPFYNNYGDTDPWGYAKVAELFEYDASYGTVTVNIMHLWFASEGADGPFSFDSENDYCILFVDDTDGKLYHAYDPETIDIVKNDMFIYLADSFESKTEFEEFMHVDATDCFHAPSENNIVFYGYSNGSSTPTDDPKPNSSSTPAHTHNFQWQTITAPTKDADGLEGEVCSCGATRNTQLLSAYGYALNEYATPMINAAKAGQTITFEFGEWNSFPKSFMAKLVDKSAQNITFVFHYKWNHVKQEITIPAGTPIDLNFDWYGPAKMAELYGAN